MTWYVNGPLHTKPRVAQSASAALAPTATVHELISQLHALFDRSTQCIPYQVHRTDTDGAWMRNGNAMTASNKAVSLTHLTFSLILIPFLHLSSHNAYLHTYRP